MKPTLLFATLSLVFATPTAFAKSELEILRSRCSEQERQIRLLEDENTKLRSGSHEVRSTVAKTESPAAALPKMESAAPAPAAPAVATTYTVKAGDSLERIARKVGATPQKLAKANGLKSNAIIRPGQRLKVPGVATAAAPEIASTAAPVSQHAGKTHKVRAGETLSSISKKHGMSTREIIAANPKIKPSALRPGQVVNLGGTAPAVSMITASKAPTPVERAAAPAPAPIAKSPVVNQNVPVSTAAPISRPAPAPAPEPKMAAAPAPAPAPPVAQAENLSPTPEKKIRPVTIEGEMTYGEFASQHGTDAERLNALNGLDLTTATVLAKGSELYVPAQP